MEQSTNYSQLNFDKPAKAIQWRKDVPSRSVMLDSATPWTATCQLPLSMEYGIGLPFPTPEARIVLQHMVTAKTGYP